MSARIYVADLAAYNNGTLHGVWIDLADIGDLEELTGMVETMLREGQDADTYGVLDPHEDFAIHDFEGFGSIKLGEYTSLAEVWEHVERMGDDPDKYFAYVSYHGEHYAEGYDEDDVVGPYESPDDWAWQYADSCYGDLHEFLRSKFGGLADYMTFDAEAFAQNAQLAEYNGKTYEIL